MPLIVNAPKTARIEVFRPGTFTPMQGAELSYSAADLKAVADAYDPETAPAPIVVGHPAADAPAFGWVTGFDFDAETDRLYANVGEIAPEFSAAVKAGRYKKVSLSFFRPDHSANPVPGTWYPKHIGFLGGAAPAVSGLKNVQFSNDAAEIVTFTASFGERGFEETASLFRSLREFLIEKFDLEDADKALSSYKIDWLDDTELEGNRAVFTAPKSQPIPKKEPVVADVDDAEFAARDSKMKSREAKLKAREDKIAHGDNVAFAEALVGAGKLLPASKNKVVAVLDALPVEETVSFAAGDDKITPAAAIRAILSDQPKVVDFSRTDVSEVVDGKTADFASDGKPVAQDQMDLHAKATDFQNKNPGTAWLTAVAAVS